MPEKQHIAFFISPHGYGHAARAAAVMIALEELEPRLYFHIYTKVPPWFFEDSGLRNFSYHELETDIGLVQSSALAQNLEATLSRLAEFLPFSNELTERLASQVLEDKCVLLLCDIAPMGIAIAKKASLPAVLIENFTWDWIYQGYLSEDVRIAPYIEYLSGLFSGADYHIQTAPVCKTATNCSLTTKPVSRKVRQPTETIRSDLEIAPGNKMLLLTMGGIPWEYSYLELLHKHREVVFVVPGGSNTFKKDKNVILFPHKNRFHHPDLVQASDAVVGKIGYSTLAEVYQAGTAFAYIMRSNFAESKQLAAFADKEMPSICIEEEEFISGEWLKVIPKLLSLPHKEAPSAPGAEQAASFIHSILPPLSL